MSAALALAVLLVPVQPDPPALDALAFGVPRAIALANRNLANRHQQWVGSNMVGDVRCRWNERQNHAYACWAALADALDFRVNPNQRAATLRALRYRIGEPAYAAGWLPSPVPDYGPEGPPLGVSEK